MFTFFKRETPRNGSSECLLATWLPVETVGTESRFRADNALQFEPGDVLNSEYEVKSVEANWRGELLYKCKGLSDGEEVVVRREDMLKHPDNSLVKLPPYQKAPISIGAPSKDGLQFVKRFAVQSGDDKFVFVVQRLEEKSENDEGDLENPRACDEPQQRPGPANASLVIWRWGDCNMKVDFLAYGSYLRYICLDLFAIAWWSFLLYFTLLVIRNALELEYLGDRLRCLLALRAFLLHYLIGVLLLVVMIRSRCRDDSLTITPTNFNLRRTIRFNNKHHTSGSSTYKAKAKYWSLCKLSWTKISGKTSDLTRAEIKERSNGEFGGVKYFALMEGQKEHKLWHFLSAAETEWLVSEVNEVLQNIKDRGGNRLGNV